MKVKIGDKIYDAEEEPIMLILTEQDKWHIQNMSPDRNKFVTFPDHLTFTTINKWSKIEQ